MDVVQIVFLILALVIVFTGFFPGWSLENGPVFVPRRIIGVVLMLVVLWLLYILVTVMFGSGPVLTSR